MFRVICLLIGYALGMVQSAYIVGRIFGKIDVREHGSGNAGTTNIARVMGAKFAVVVLFADVMKAVLAYVICSNLFCENGMTFLTGSTADVLPGLYGGAGAVLGHVFPAVLGFRGGKGIASALGMALLFDIRIGGLCLAVGVLIIVFARYVSLASLVGAVMFAVLIPLYGYGPEVAAWGVMLCALIFYKHWQNIIRLIGGKENKMTWRRQKS